MADVESNINIHVDTSNALAQIKRLQAQISAFHQQMSRGGAAAAAASAQLQQNLINSINATGQFSAGMTKIKSSTENFTTALEKNKLSMGQYFRYAIGSSQTFGKIFRSEFETINKVARERVKTLQTQYIKMGRDANGALQAIAVRPLALDMKDLSTRTQIAAQKQQIFNQLIKQGSTNLLNFGKNTQWAGRQLMVGFTVPLTIMGAAAAKEFMKLEEQAIRFKRVYGDSFTPSAEAEQMMMQIRGLADEYTKYGLAVADTMKMAADAAAMGKKGADLLAQVAQASTLAVLGGVDQQKALETTTSLTNAFGVATEDLAGKINFLNAVENQTVTSIDDLTTAIPIAAPVVKQLGGNVEDLAFFLTAMREGGINASEGANALKSGLASIINPSQQAVDLLNSFGVNLKGIVEADRGNVKKMVLDLASALNQLDPLNRAQAIEQLFGKFQFSRLSTLFQNVTKEGSQASRVLDLTRASAAELAVLSERELKKVESSPMYKFKKSIEDMKAALAPVGEQFLKAITPIVEFVTKLLDKFNDMGDGAKSFAVIATTVVAGIGPVLLMTFGLIANGVANLIKFFQFISNVFRGAGGSSKILGEQLNYMTQEQLEAAAVAASLEQSHSRLTQQFTSEAQAVQKLITAYQAAVAAQGKFMSAGAIARGGKGGMPPRKMASGGIVRGPGTGTSDSIPAMLSDGEAVIPAKQAQKYGGLINGIIANNIPGYKTGSSGVGVHKAHLTVPFAQGSPQFAAGLNMAGLQNLDKQLLQYVNVVSNLVAELPVALNMQLQKGSATIQSFSKQWNSRTGKLNASASMGGADVSDPKVQQGLAKLEKEIHDRTITLAKGTKDQKISDPLLAKATREVIDKYKDTSTSAGKAARALDAASQQVGQVRLSVPKSAVTAGLQSGSLRQDAGGRVYAGNAQVGRISQSANSAGKLRPADPRNAPGGYAKKRLMSVAVESEAIGEQLVTTASQGLAKGARKALKTASPSKVMDEIGQQSGQGLSNGARKKKKDAQLAGEELGLAVTTGAASQATRAYNSGQYRDPVTGRFAKDPAITAKNAEASKEASRARAQKISGRVGGAGMVASTALMGMSMAGGKTGEVASQLMMPTMIASMIAPMLISALAGPQAAILGPIIAVVAVIAGVGLVITGMVDAFNKARDAAMALAESTGASGKSVKQFSEFAGTVSAGEIRKKQREEAMTTKGLAAGKETFGASYLQSDAGKDIVKSINENITKNGREFAKSQLVNQLSNAVAAGALTAVQAKSVAANLAAEIGDIQFGIQVNGKLNELIGVNGENLLEDPLGIRIKIIESGQKDLSKVLNVTQAQVAYENLKGNMMDLGKNMLNSVTLGIPAAIGFFDRLGTVTGAMVGQYNNLLDLTQEQLDAYDLEYQKRIDNAKLLGDEARVNYLINEQIQGRGKLIQKQIDLQTQMEQKYKTSDAFMQKAFTENMIKAVENQFKGTDQEAIAKAASDAIINAPLSNEREFTLLAKLKTEQIGPTQLLDMLNTFKDPAELNKILNTILNVDSGAAGQITELMGLFQTKEQKLAFSVYIESLVNNDAIGPGGVQEYIDLFAQMSQLQSVADVSAIMSFYVKNPKQLEKLKADIKTLDSMGDISFEAAANVVGIPELATLTQYADAFNALPASSRKSFITNVETIYSARGEPGFQASKKSEETRLGTSLSDADFAARTAAKAFNEGVNARNAQAQADYEQAMADYQSSGGGGGGGEIAASAIDDLMKKLRDVRSLTTQMTKGWNETRQALDNMFGSGISGFGGLQQQMRNLGAGEDLISLIAGMDPAEFNRRKDELFTFDAAGNISAFRGSLVSLGEALRSITLGEFQNQQQKTIGTFKDQTVAIRKLVAAGMSYADAYNAVQDATFAAAIAGEKQNDVIKQTIANANEATKALKNMAAAQAVANKNEETTNKKAILDFINQNQQNLSNAVIEKMLSDSNFATLIMNPRVDPATLEKAIKDAEAEANLTLNIDKTNISGMEKIFSDGFNKAMDAFSTQEKAIELDFQIKRNPLEKIIESAEQTISDLQNAPGGLDDLNADLERISDKEKDINKEYDDKLEALDKVQKANDKLIRQQKTQLSLADAITQGDIAAAAKAAQDMRAQNLDDAMATQREALEKAKQIQLENVIAQTGLTREQIEKRIRDINAQILDIQESQIEPAKYQLELLDRQQKAQVDALTVAGKTKTEWEQIKNSIDLARVNSNTYKTALEEALLVVENIKTYWDDLDGSEITAKIIYDVQPLPGATDIAAGAGNIAPAPEQTSGGGGGGAAPPTPPTPEPTVDIPEIGGNGENWFKDNITDPISNWFKDLPNQGWFQSLVAIFSPFVDFWMEHIAKPIMDTFNNIATWWNNGPGKFLNEAFTNIGIWWDTYVGGPINRVIQTIGTWWDTYVVQPIQRFFNWFFSPSSIEQKKKDIAKFVEDVKANFARWQNEVKTFWETLPQKIGEWFSNIATTVGNTFKGIINNVIRAINGIKFTAPDWIPVIGGKSWSPSIPLLLNSGGLVGGVGNTDSVPSMLTPGEFVISKDMVQRYGVNVLDAINKGKFTAPQFKEMSYGNPAEASSGSSVYNNTYSINVNVKSGANADEIARTVMTQIKQIDAQRIRGNRF